MVDTRCLYCLLGFKKSPLSLLDVCDILLYIRCYYLYLLKSINYDSKRIIDYNDPFLIILREKLNEVVHYSQVNKNLIFLI